MTNKITYKPLIILSILLAVVTFNDIARLTLPVPWIDESWFLWQSLSFTRSNTLLAAELIADRPVMWMQPGYMILTGLYFKLVHFSLENARALTLAFYLLATTLYCILVCRERSARALIFAAVIFLLPSSIASSNVARMEAMILALGVFTLLTALNKKYILALALTLISGLIHTNGLYFFIVLTLVIFLDRREFVKNIQATSRSHIGFLILAIGLIFCYMAFVLINFEAFRTDMALQFSRKLSRKPFFLDPRAIAALLLALCVLCYKVIQSKRDDSIIACYALTAILVFANGQEMWYQIFRNVGIGTLLLLISDMIRPSLRWYAAPLLLSGLVLVSGGMSFAGMKPSLLRDGYISRNVKDALEAQLLTIQSSRSGLVSASFNNTGADLLFYDFFQKNDIHVIRRMPAEMAPLPTSDLCIYLSGRGDPDWMRKDITSDLPDPKLCKEGLFMSRSPNEILMLSPTEYTKFLNELKLEVK